MALNPNKIKSLDFNPNTEKKVNFDTYPDYNGLYLYVYSKNKKWWRFRCRHNGKQVMIALGTWPKVTLENARKQAKKLYNLAKQGINPAEEIKREKEAAEKAKNNTFEAVALEWQAVKKHDVTEKSKYRITYGFEKYVFPFIGKMPISEIKSPQIKDIARRMEASGLTETVHRVIGYCSNVFLYAIADGRAESDPTTAAKKQLKPLPKEPNHMAAAIEPKKVGELLRMIDGYSGTAIVKAALKLAPLVFVRPGELRHAEWADFDFNQKQWAFTASKTKTPHIVPLSKQALDILAELKPITGQGRYVFPAPTSSSRPMSNNAVLAAFRRMGVAKEEHSGHGWRATARTLLDEQLKYPPHIIEHQLAHTVKDPLGRAYNRTKHLDERREMMQAWADFLDELKK